MLASMEVGVAATAVSSAMEAEVAETPAASLDESTNGTYTEKLQTASSAISTTSKINENFAIRVLLFCSQSKYLLVAGILL